jgi:EmrB/QacA subfamily drug resistance transporter
MTQQISFPENSHRWWVLVATGLCLGLSFLDQTAVVVIFPTIQKSLAATTLQMEWMINTYLLAMAVLFVLGGRLGDVYGERRTFLMGIAIFLVASILCGIALNVEVLIASRMLLGVGSALLIPAQMVIILSAFPVSQRGRAVGINLSIASIFLVLGGFLGGVITELSSWRMVFWLNVPLCLVSASIVIWLVTPDKLKNTVPPMDWSGLFWQLLSVSTLVIGIMELGYWSWVLCLSLLITSLISFYVLYKVEVAKAHPLISFHIFKIKAFTTGCIIIPLIQLVLVAGIFMPLFYQDVLGATPVMAGLMTLPGALPVLFMGPVGGLLVDRFGARLPLLLGLTLLVLSGVWIAALLHLRDYEWLLPGLLVFGFGVPLIMSSMFITALNSIEVHNRGLASGTLGMLRQVGSAVGLAAASAIVNISNHWSIATQLAHSNLSTNVGTVQSIFSTPQILQSFLIIDQAKIINIAKNALALAVNFSTLWTALIVMLLWFIAFVRTKNSAGFLQKDKK